LVTDKNECEWKTIKDCAEENQIKKLDLGSDGGQRLSTQIPSDMGLLTKLTLLSLRSSSFTGTLP